MTTHGADPQGGFKSNGMHNDVQSKCKCMSRCTSDSCRSNLLLQKSFKRKILHDVDFLLFLLHVITSDCLVIEDRHVYSNCFEDHIILAESSSANQSCPLNIQRQFRHECVTLLLNESLYFGVYYFIRPRCSTSTHSYALSNSFSEAKSVAC